MNDLLNNPAVQAGVVPFIVALIVAAVLRRTGLLGLAVGAGFLAVVSLVMGLSFESLTSVRKMVLVGLAASLLVLPLELARVRASLAARGVLSVAAGLAAVWVVLRLLEQRESGAALAGVATVIYLTGLVKGGLAVGEDPVRSASAVLMLGLGSGALALLGASAMLAQLGIAIGASAGGPLLVQMIAGQRSPAGWTLALPGAVAAGLVGLLAVHTGELRWFSLVPMLAVPWATLLVPAGTRPVWLTAVLDSLAALVPALLAVAIAWATSGSPAT